METSVLEHAMPRETGATKGSTHQHTHYVCDTSLRKERVCHKPETMEGRLMTPIREERPRGGPEPRESYVCSNPWISARLREPQNGSKLPSLADP